MSFIYLASQSPRRAELLAQLGITIVNLPPNEGEDLEYLEIRLPRESARHYVQRVTSLKAGAAVLRHRHRKLVAAPILAADTTVVCGARILGKPGSADEARAMLTLLAGREHRVLTAVAVTDGRKLRLALSESRVSMRALSAREISAYVATGEPFGKAGSYAMQGRAAGFITRIIGSHSGIVGLPLCETAELLKAFGIDLWQRTGPQTP